MCLCSRLLFEFRQNTVFLSLPQRGTLLICKPYLCSIAKHVQFKAAVLNINYSELKLEKT